MQNAKPYRKIGRLLCLSNKFHFRLCNISHLIYYIHLFEKFVFDCNFWFLKHSQRHSLCAELCVACLLITNSTQPTKKQQQQQRWQHAQTFT